MLLYTPWLVTLDYVRQDRRLSDDAAEQKDDPLISDYIAECSAEFQEGVLPAGRIFAPYTATIRLDYDSPYSLPLDEDLLEVNAFTNGDGTTLAEDSFLYTPSNGYPKQQIDLSYAASVRFTHLSDKRQAMSLAGIWGCVPQYLTGAFKSSGVVVPSGGLDGGDTDVTVANGGGLRFQVGQYIRFRDTSKELAQVTGIEGDDLTLSREELGTSAAGSHAANTVIEVYQPPRDVMAAVRAMVVYRYMHKDAIGSRVSVIANGVVSVEDLDPAVQKTLDRYRKQILYFGAP